VFHWQRFAHSQLLSARMGMLPQNTQPYYDEHQTNLPSSREQKKKDSMPLKIVQPNIDSVQIRNILPIRETTISGASVSDRYFVNATDDVLVSSSVHNKKPASSKLSFHQWGNNNEGIEIGPLLAYMKDLRDGNDRRISIHDPKWGHIPVVIRPGDPASPSLKASKVVFDRRDGVITGRLVVLGLYLQEILNNFVRSNEKLFPSLRQALDSNVSIPLVFAMQDFQECNMHNYNYTGPGNDETQRITSVPFITLSADPSCEYKFPIPSYTTIQLVRKQDVILSQANPSKLVANWTSFFAELEGLRPWRTKRQRAVWRGALTGPWKGPRYQLVQLASQHNVLDAAVAGACDIRKPNILALFSHVPSFSVSSRLSTGMMPDRVKGSKAKEEQWIRRNRKIYEAAMPMERFWDYRAIIDLDGNSWSERFPRLLCGNSVVIKLDPKQADYFWPSLEPYIHYMPANLSNIVDVATYSVSDEHQEEMLRIVRNTQEWCHNHLVSIFYLYLVIRVLCNVGYGSMEGLT
jgi:hypothetical protein